jgi:hypothetical protein
MPAPVTTTRGGAAGDGLGGKSMAVRRAQITKMRRQRHAECAGLTGFLCGRKNRAVSFHSICGGKKFNLTP